MSNIKKVGKKLVELGYQPLPIIPNGKMPAIKNWTGEKATEITDETIDLWLSAGMGEYGVGIRCGRVIAIDIDIDKLEVTNSVIKHMKDMLGDCPIRFGRPGRALAVFRTEETFKKKKLNVMDPTREKFAIEVLANGQQFVAFGIHPDIKSPYQWMDDKSIEGISVSDLSEISETDIDNFFEGVMSIFPNDWKLESKKEVVKTDNWESAALEQQKRLPEELMTPEDKIHWKALDNLELWVKDVFPGARAYHEGYRVSSKSLGRDLQEDIQITPEGIMDFGEERGLSVLECVAIHKFSEDYALTAAWLKDKLGIEDNIDGEEGDWWTDWYFVGDRDRLFRWNSTEWLTEKGFNAKYTRMMLPSKKGTKNKAFNHGVISGLFPVVQSCMYAPALGKTFTWSGRTCVNSFVPDSLVKPSAVLSDDGKEAVRLVDSHLKLLCGGENVEYYGLMDWLSWAVQHPGEKIAYTPIIKGPQGVGKTTIGRLMEACLGTMNVRTVNPTVIMSNFNGYAENNCLVILEELHVQGHNRYDVANALKPLITDTIIDVHRKGKDSYKAMNVCNYIAFTNRSDAIPIEETDRRFFVIFSPWGDVAEMLGAGVEASKEYFDKLYYTIRNYAPDLCRWFKDYKQGKDFDPKGTAPYTFAKEAMKSAIRDESEDLIRDLLQAGGSGFNRRIVSSGDLTEKLKALEFDDATDDVDIPRGKRLHQIMKKLGFDKYPNQVKWKGKPRRVYIRGNINLSTEDVRVLLDKTDTVLR